MTTDSSCDQLLPGTVRWFEYRCWESNQSAHAHIWRQSHQQVTVLGVVDDCEPAALDMSREEREDAALPLVYQVQFPDGTEEDVFEEELLDSPDEFQRPPPPDRRHP